MKMTFKRTVCIVDDHTLLCQALSSLINTFENFKVIGTYSNGSDYIKALENNKSIPDITLMDVRMPIFNGIETTAFLSKKYPKIKILALSVEADENTILKMLKAGAKGYLLKDIEKKELESALNYLIRHDFYHSQTITDAIDKFSGSFIDNIKLKDKEIDFLRLACSELTYKKIAEIMKMSHKTVDGYRNSLFKKLKIKNRVGLALFAVKHKIYTIE
jgi:DNA-binding NarL/FixJ family response regulator